MGRVHAPAILTQVVEYEASGYLTNELLVREAVTADVVLAVGHVLRVAAIVAASGPLPTAIKSGGECDG